MKFKTLTIVGTLSTLFFLKSIAAEVSADSLFELAENIGLFNTSIHPTLERRETNEATSIKNAALFMFKTQMATEPDHRDAHAKAAGCVAAQFKVISNLPTELVHGVFQPGRTYDSLIRFSNGAGITKSDAAPDARGMAIKVLGALDREDFLSEGLNQDFLLVNQPRFFLGSVETYARFNQVSFEDKNPGRFFLERAIVEVLTTVHVSKINVDSLKPLMVALTTKVGPEQKPDPRAIAAAVEILAPGLSNQILPLLFAKLGEMQAKKAPLELKLAIEALGQATSNLNQTYTSMTSFLMSTTPGSSTDTAVKYVTRPFDCSTGTLIKADANVGANPPDNLLRLNLDKEMKSARCFNFYIQPLPTSASASEKIVLVEDARLDYNTPEILIAQITIPAQPTDVPSKHKYCENLSFNPWHARPEHQPLGGLNRARKVAVTVSSMRRHLHLGSERVEPTSTEAFRNLK